MKRSLSERLAAGPVICAEGYLFELERRGYVQAGPFVPEVVLQRPETVKALHREFLWAGSDIIEAFTYYGHREKLRFIGKEDILEPLNRQALTIAAEVAAEAEEPALVAGNICNTTLWGDGEAATEKLVRSMFEEQVGWAAEAGVDLVIAETFSHHGEAELAVKVIREAGLPAVVTLGWHRGDSFSDGVSLADSARRLEQAGAEVVGLNCMRGPDTIYPGLMKMREAVKCHVGVLPVPYRTSEDQPTFQSLKDPGCGCIPDDRPFPAALDPFTCNRYELAQFAKKVYDQGVHYIGLCCGGAPHHIRAMAEALGKKPPASANSPDMSRHFAYGKAAKAHNQELKNEL